MARPRKEIDRELFEKLCEIHCTQEEIAGFFNCHTETIANWCLREYEEPYFEIYKRTSANGKISLRRRLFSRANESDKVLLFACQHILGMKENEFNTDDIKESLKNIKFEVTDGTKK